MRKHWETSSEANKKRIQKQAAYTIHLRIADSEVADLVMALGPSECLCRARTAPNAVSRAAGRVST